MRNILFSVFCCILFVIFLISPALVFEGASQGLLLWFHTVLPTLFPFMVLTTILTNTKAIHFISSVFAPVLCPLLRISQNACLAVIGGFLCGYPMGAKIISDLWETGQISRTEGLYLLSFCNNISPAFVISFIMTQKLLRPDLILPTLVILFLAPLLSSFLFRRYYQEETHFERLVNRRSSGLQVIDHAITGGMETITKLGGYIIFFSILVLLLRSMPADNRIFTQFIIPALEITNGIDLISKMPLPFIQKYFLILIHTSFGGICAVFQTKCVLQSFDVPFGQYILEKLVTTAVTSFLALFYIQIFLSGLFVLTKLSL